MDHTTSNLTKNNRQKDIISYNLDHVYCSDDSSYRNNSNNSPDVKALRKENKQLQAMLLLHLDLIQEQSNQLIAKDKQLTQLREEIKELRSNCERLERRTKMGIRQSSGNLDEYSSLPDVTTGLVEDKVKLNNVKSTKTVQQEEKVTVEATPKKIPEILEKDRIGKSNSVVSKDNQKVEIVVPIISRSVESNNIIGHSNECKDEEKVVIDEIRRIVVSETPAVVQTPMVAIATTAAVQVPSQISSYVTITSTALTNTNATTSTTAALSKVNNSSSIVDTQYTRDSNKIIPLISQDTNQNLVRSSERISSSSKSDVSVRSANERLPTVKIEIKKEDLDNRIYSVRENKNKNVVEHKDIEVPSKIARKSKDTTFSSAAATTTTPSISSSSSIYNGMKISARRHSSRSSIITTKKLYKTREWQLDEIEAEINRQIAAEPSEETMIDSEQMNLEIPKWRTWKFSDTSSHHSSEPAEDLSEDAFVKRHARFLLDERKRKKWDVQRIREQRTIERLKRRHCKDELNDQKDSEEIISFFPLADNLKVIQLTDYMPVSAFGECIPALQPEEFSLPWQRDRNASTTNVSHPHPHPQTHESFTHQPQTIISSHSDNLANKISSLVFMSKKRAGRNRIHHIAPISNIPPITSSMLRASTPIPTASPFTTVTSPVRQRRTRHRQ